MVWPSVSRGQLRVVEIKSLPKVDGQVGPLALGSALDQGALYTLLVEPLFADLALDPSLVSRRLVLICPRNVVMKPCLSERDVSARMRRIRQLLDGIPVVGGQPVAPFGDVARAARRTVALSSRRRGGVSSSAASLPAGPKGVWELSSQGKRRKSLPSSRDVQIRKGTAPPWPRHRQAMWCRRGEVSMLNPSISSLNRSAIARCFVWGGAVGGGESEDSMPPGVARRVSVPVRTAGLGWTGAVAVLRH